MHSEDIRKKEGFVIKWVELLDLSAQLSGIVKWGDTADVFQEGSDEDEASLCPRR